MNKYLFAYQDGSEGWKISYKHYSGINDFFEKNPLLDKNIVNAQQLTSSAIEVITKSPSEMIDWLVADDIAYIGRQISEGDTEYLTSILRGEGWKPYPQFEQDELVLEYDTRIEFEKEQHED